ncbi:hypothetical protein ABW19_dt0207244 [Dactylella cylindrospora]|nr:hypothetical protein ABW19_dt0207244 [Dactylella cylindrospora]
MPREEFEDLDWANIEYIFGDDLEKGEQYVRTDSPSFSYHGTGMLSLLLGKKLGVARKVTPAIVKWTNMKGEARPTVYLRALERTVLSIKQRIAKNPDVRIIVYMSNSIKPKTWTRKRVGEEFYALSKMRNVLVVLPAPEPKWIDEQFDTDIDYLSEHVPIALGELTTATAKIHENLGLKEDFRFSNLIVVAGSDSKGELATIWARYMKVAGPLRSTLTAGPGGQKDIYREWTSSAMPAIGATGVLATLISTHGYTAEEAKVKLYELAFHRAVVPTTPDDVGLSAEEMDSKYRRFPRVIYNGMGNPWKPDEDQLEGVGEGWVRDDGDTDEEDGETDDEDEEGDEGDEEGEGSETEGSSLDWLYNSGGESSDSGSESGDEEEIVYVCPTPVGNVKRDMKGEASGSRTTKAVSPSRTESDPGSTAAEETMAVYLGSGGSTKAAPTKRIKTVTRTMSNCGAASTPRAGGGKLSPTAQTSVSTAEPTVTLPPYVYNATFCKVCMEADGKYALNGIVWIPQDCPCRPEDRGKS